MARIDLKQSSGLPIFYSRQIEDLEFSPVNLKRQFASGRLQNVCAPGSWGSELFQIQPGEKEIVLEKYSYDFFSNLQLEKELQQREIDTLIITGLNTDLCIDTTVRSAFTRGYNIIIPKDLVTSTLASVEIQDYFLKLFHNFLGEVTTSNAILQKLYTQAYKK